MKRKFLIPLAVIFLGAILYFVNRDIYRYTYDSLCQRTFSPDIESKGDYLVSEQIGLKPGSYVLSPEISVEGYGSGLYLVDGSGTEILSVDLESGLNNPEIPFEIQGGSKQIRMGVRYDPETSSVVLKRIHISAEHILYRESLLRHLTISCLCVLLTGLLTLRLGFEDCFFRLFPFLKGNEFSLLIIFVLTVLTTYPLLNTETYVEGQDMFFHLTRIRGLADSLKAGYFPVRNQLYWLKNYGYGVGFYYPDVFLYFPAVLMLLGFQLLTSYKIFLGICSFLSIAMTYIAAKRISGIRIAGYAAAILMACSSYRLSNLYYRGAVGETQAAVFYPLILLGLYEILYGKKQHWPLFALGFWGLLSSHVISTFMAFSITALVILFNLKTVLKSREIVLALLKSVTFVLLAGAFFLLPMAEQTWTNPGLRVNTLIETGENNLNFNYAFPVKNLFSLFKPWDFAYQARSIYPGWAYLLVILLRIFLLGKEQDSLLRRTDGMLITALVLLAMCTEAFPWAHFQWFVNRVQFAYRLLLPSSVITSVAGGIYFSRLLKQSRQCPGLCLLLIAAFFSTAFPVLQESVQHRSVPKRLFVMQDNRISGGEYLPTEYPRDFPAKNADTVLPEDADIPLMIVSHDRKGLGFSFAYELPENSGEQYFRVPLNYYTGFKGTLTNADGLTTPLQIERDSQGFIRVSNQGCSSGEVSVWFEKTTVSRISEVITLLTFLISGVRFCCGSLHFGQKRFFFGIKMRMD